MPHVFDISGLSERLFVLHNLCHASKPLCSAYKINRVTEDPDEYDWYEYYGYLKLLVSENLIHISTRLRMMQDTIESAEEDLDWNDIDRSARDGLNLAKYTKGSGKISIRELCNKIIHATEITLDWESLDENDETSPEYWTGLAVLSGQKDRKDWQIQLSVESLCVAFHRYVDAVDGQVDWHAIYKYDE